MAPCLLPKADKTAGSAPRSRPTRHGPLHRDRHGGAHAAVSQTARTGPRQRHQHGRFDFACGTPDGWPAIGDRCGRASDMLARRLVRSISITCVPISVRGNADPASASALHQDVGEPRIRAAVYHRTHGDEFHLYREHEDYYVRTDDGFLVFETDTAASWYARPTTTSATRRGCVVPVHRPLRRLCRPTRAAIIKSNLLGVDSLGCRRRTCAATCGSTRTWQWASGGIWTFRAVRHGGVERELDVWDALCAGSGALA